jgi:ubiquitin-protein ligase
MSLRIRRLANELQLLRDQFGSHPHVEVQPLAGDPPERYRVTYRLAGLERRPDGSLVVRREHHMEIVLPAEYPRQPASCRMLTPVFHPNIDAFTVCTSDFHAAQETLADLIIRVAQMIAFQKHNVKSPLNAEAAVWCETNLARLPVDRADLYPGSGVPVALPPPAPAAVRMVPTVSEDVDGCVIDFPDPVSGQDRVTSVRITAGQPVRADRVELMLGCRLRPFRLVIQTLDGVEEVAVPVASESSLEIGGMRIRVRGADRTSMATIGPSGDGADPGGRAATVFWNGVCATQIELVHRLVRMLEASPLQSPEREKIRVFARKKVSHIQSLDGLNRASPTWRSRLSEVGRYLASAIGHHEGSPHAT